MKVQLKDTSFLVNWILEESPAIEPIFSGPKDLEDYHPSEDMNGYEGFTVSTRMGKADVNIDGCDRLKYYIEVVLGGDWHDNSKDMFEGLPHFLKEFSQRDSSIYEEIELMIKSNGLHILDTGTHFLEATVDFESEAPSVQPTDNHQLIKIQSFACKIYDSKQKTEFLAVLAGAQWQPLPDDTKDGKPIAPLPDPILTLWSWSWSIH